MKRRHGFDLLGRYILDGHTPVPCPSLMKWAQWLEKATPESRRVARDELVVDGVEYLVSTVFLMLDHNFSGKGPPILFETAVFTLDDKGDTKENLEQWRYSNWDDAATGHQAAINRLKERAEAPGA